jgi:phosphoglycerate dehydrogenase-like enzyme
MNESIEVLITVPFSDELLAQLRSVSPRLRINSAKVVQATELPADVWQRVEILYSSRVLPMPEQAPRLRWIQFHSAGIDHAIGHPVFSKPGLVATTLSGAAVYQVAEYVLMMLLAAGRHLPELLEHQKRADWPRDRWKRFSPQELNASTVGIVGYGSIGREVARLLRAFGAEVLAVKRNVLDPEDRGYIPEGLGDPIGTLARRLYPLQALRSMLKECDFIVVTIPLTNETRSLIGVDELAACKPSAFLVDVSRGGVVNHQALINALRERKLAGAALDVFPEEPLPSDSPLWKLGNVILTPHIAGNTVHYDERAVALFAENLHRYLSGLQPYNVIDLGRGY